MRQPRWTLVVILSATGCGGRKEPATVAAHDDAGPSAVATAADRCERVPFAESLSVSAASGAALAPIDAADALLVIGDSGNRGAYVIADPTDGTEREVGRLPLGTSRGDDLEGLAVRDGGFVAITSSGFFLTWRREEGAFALADGPYRAADPATGLSCGERDVNCGKNYEGLCLRSGPVGDGECVGLAAAKQDGRLYCVVLAGTRLEVTARSIAVSGPETLTGCDIAPDGAVWAGTNLFGHNTIYRITDWTRPEAARVDPVGAFGVGFGESLAAGPDDAIYRFSDLAGAPSAVAKFRCPTPGR
jgi:hypothetical protein